MTEPCKQKIPDWKQLWKSLGVRCLRRQHLAVPPTEIRGRYDTGLHNPTDDGLQRSSLHEEFFISTKRSLKILTQLCVNKAVNTKPDSQTMKQFLIYFLKEVSPPWEPSALPPAGSPVGHVVFQFALWDQLRDSAHVRGAPTLRAETKRASEQDKSSTGGCGISG